MVRASRLEVGERDAPDGARDAAVLVGVQDLFAGIEEDAVAVGEALIGEGLARLAAVVEGDRRRTHTFWSRSPTFCGLCRHMFACQ